MEMVLQNTKTVMLESLNTIFIKWWGVTPLMMLTWFSDRILLFLTPKDVEGWSKLAFTFLVGGIAVLYTLRQKQRSEKHDEEKHRQELAQDKMNAWIEQWDKARKAGIINEQTTLAEFIKQLDLIEAANASQKHA